MAYQALETQEIFRRIYDSDSNALRMSISGTVSGDLTITGDLTVQGSSTVETDSNVTGDFTLQGQQIIDTTNAEAFLVRKDGDAGDVFAVNTTAGTVGIGTASPSSPSGIKNFLEIYSTDHAGIVMTEELGGTPFSWEIYINSKDLNFNFEGSNMITVLDTGEVGIGTDTPENPLHIYSAAGNSLLRLESGDSIASILMLDHLTTNVRTFSRIANDLSILPDGGNVGIGTDSPAELLDLASAASGMRISDSADSNNVRGTFQVSAGNGGFMNLYDTDEVQQAVIRGYAVADVQAYFTAGNVGFGTDSPSAITHIKNSAITTDTDVLIIDAASAGVGHEERIAFKVQDSTYPLSYIGSAFESDLTDSYLSFATRTGSSVTEKMRLTSAGQARFSDGTEATPSMSFLSDTDTGFYTAAAGTMRLSLGGSSEYYWSSTVFQVGSNSYTPVILNEAPTGSNPVFSFLSDDDTGIGHNDADELSLVAGGKEMMRLDYNDDVIIPFAPIELGSLLAETDSGYITLANMPISSASTSGDEMGFAISLDSEPIVSALCQSDGTGGVKEKHLKVGGYFKGLERSSDPEEPAEGEFIIWMSDGTGKGDDGDVLIASQAGGNTTYTTLFDNSAGTAW